MPENDWLYWYLSLTDYYIKFCESVYTLVFSYAIIFLLSNLDKIDGNVAGSSNSHLKLIQRGWLQWTKGSA